MTSLAQNTKTLTLRVKVRPDSKASFVDWQSKLNAAVAKSKGFISLEILAPDSPDDNSWIIIERFQDPVSLSQWLKSSDYQKLNDSLKKIGTFEESNSEEWENKTNITEVFVAEVLPEKEEAYREWIAKIHQVEAKFQGFRGMYVQSPLESHGKSWLTFLQFDSQENLDRWLISPERKEVLKKADGMITSLESHRVISPYAGWFSAFVKEGEVPSLWKQTMIILLVLFPIVMLEFKFLNPYLTALNISPATFISNAVSVSLISWVAMPIAIYFLGWWLSPKNNQNKKLVIRGTLIVLALYLLEVILLWSFV